MVTGQTFAIGVFACLLAACVSQPSREQQNKAIRVEVSKEIARICALSPEERQAEISRVKAESGMVIVCP